MLSGNIKKGQESAFDNLFDSDVVITEEERLHTLAKLKAISYASQELTDEEKLIVKNNIGIVDTNNTIEVTFTEVDIINNKITVAHPFNTKRVYVVTYNSNGKQFVPSDVQVTTNNSVDVYLENLSLPGTNVILLVASTNSIHPSVMLTKTELDQDLLNNVKYMLPDQSSDIQISSSTGTGYIEFIATADLTITLPISSKIASGELEIKSGTTNQIIYNNNVWYIVSI